MRVNQWPASFPRMKTVKTVYEVFSLQHINFDVKQISKVVLQEWDQVRLAR